MRTPDPVPAEKIAAGLLDVILAIPKFPDERWFCEDLMTP